MSIFDRFIGKSRPREALEPLYRKVVAHGRDPEWYRKGGVPDTQDGRFDMIAAILSLVLIRLENEGEARASECALLAEVFIADMDGQLREIGVGDVGVGKQVGRMVGALGGRISAYRGAFTGNDAFSDALARNLYRGERPDEEALGFVENRLCRFARALRDADDTAIVAGTLPELP